MKKLILLLVLAISFMSCEKDEASETEQAVLEAKVIGTWELYRDENLESIIDEWTGTEWTYVDQWFQNTREDSGIILEFRDDNTFSSLYVDVETATGTWALLDNGDYYFDYNQEDANLNEQLEQRRYLTMHCDNTNSVTLEGNDRAFYYYKKIGTTECSELIDYNVE
jgi:hypothetical protein